METKQPVWKYAGHLGDVDPIAYGGGFVYTDKFTWDSDQIELRLSFDAWGKSASRKV